MAKFRQETEYRRYGFVEVEADNEYDASDLVYYMSDEEKARRFQQTGEWWQDADEYAYLVDE